ncbi:hypothetical protein ACW7N6_38000 [Streptomyces sp. UC1A3]
MISIRLRSRISKQELEEKVGKVIGDDAYNVLLTGPTRVFMPNGQPLCVYLPGAMRDAVTDEQYEILHSLHGTRTGNRGLAGGAPSWTQGKQWRAFPVSSAVLGSLDSKPPRNPACRLTAWTGKNLPQWEALRPALRAVADSMRAYVPERYAAQMEEINRTHPDWVVPGTPFTTITVNNTYPTGVHTDKGDLDKGFSTIFALRRGEYTGGRFVFPEFRVAVDLQDGDLILMDAHQWHGNTAIVCACGEKRTAYCDTCGAERISVVSYMRTAMTQCGSEAEEIDRAREYRERTKGVVR